MLVLGTSVVAFGQTIVPGAQRCLVVHQESFDANLWGSTFPCDLRTSMADDLVKHHLSIGMTREQVVALLGQPDPSYVGVYAGERTVAYDMGGFTDTNWLIVHFDHNWLLKVAFWYQD